LGYKNFMGRDHLEELRAERRMALKCEMCRVQFTGRNMNTLMYLWVLSSVNAENLTI
jgi:hypothetical protein